MNAKSTRTDGVAPAAASAMYPPKLGTKKFRKIPHCIYFYYLAKNDQGNIVITHYYFTEANNDEIDPDDLPATIIELARNAQETDEEDQVPPPIGTDLDFVVWTRKSYIVFIIDADYEFVGEGVEIVARDSSPNVTFYDGEVSTINIPNRPNASFFRCINHMKKNGGNDLGRIAQRYKITLLTDKVLPRPAPNHDDGGTNMGPPVPPP